MTAGDPRDDDVAAIDRAVGALESQRAVLGDDVVETALAPLRQRRAALQTREAAEQRKLVTVVFADIVDFTVVSRQLDAEDVRDVVGSYFARWQRVIEDHGGVVEKFIGDAVMAVFGLYRSREDDARRAVRAALAMTGSLEELNRDVQRRHGVTLQMRVGIDTGNVVVSTLDERAGHEFVVVGPTVNRASRLQAAASPGEVLVSSETRRPIRGWFSMEARPGLVLKGHEEPVDGYLVLSERPHGFRLDRAGGVEGVETRTVGRDVEMRFLQDRTWDVTEDSGWKVVTVFGDAGLGKSRLLFDFDTWLGERAQNVWWFRGRASQTSQNRANALLHDMMASRLAILDSDSPHVVRAKFTGGFLTAFGSEVDAERHADLVMAWLGFDQDDTTSLPSEPQTLREEAARSLAEYFARLSGVAPVVILLEDLHWADDGSLYWLDAADAVLRERQVLVVATSRPSLLEERPHWGEGRSHHVRLTLSPFSRRESRLLLDQILRLVRDPPDALVELVITTAEGNPFYIEELVTWLIDAGVIVRGRDSWTVVEELIRTVVVPSTLRGVLQARLDALAAHERGLLQRASVVGRVFWDDAVVHLDARDTSAEAGQTLDHLRSRELVFEREVSTFGSTREFLFKHALLRDVAYDGLLRAHRERYHLLTADWLASVSERTGRRDEFAALIAEHYDRASHAAAASWYLTAGVLAAAVYALEESTRLLGRGLDVAPDGDPMLRFDLLAAREEVLDRVGDREGQQRDLAELDELGSRIEDGGRRVRLLIAKSRWSFAASEYDDAVRYASSAADIAQSVGLVKQAGEAHLWRGKAMTWGPGMAAGARESLDRALEVALAGGYASLRAESLRYLGLVANNEGDYPRAVDLLAQAAQTFADSGDSEGEGAALAQLGSTYFNMGRVVDARRIFEQVQPIFRRSGHLYRESIVLGNLATILLTQGELAKAERWCVDALGLTRQLHDKEATASNLCVLGMIELLTSRFEPAEGHLLEALELGNAVGSATLRSEALTRLTFLALDLGRRDESIAFARQAVEACAEGGASHLERGHALLALGYATLGSDGHSEAASAFDGARANYASLEFAALVRESEAGSAAVLLRQGDLEAAVRLVDGIREHLDVEGLENVHRPGQVLRTCWQVLEAAGDPTAASALHAARAYLGVRADAIGDERLARGYLTAPVNAGLRATDEG